MVELVLTPHARRRLLRANVPAALVPALLLGCGLGGLHLLAGRTGRALVFVGVGLALAVLGVVLPLVHARRARVVFGDGTYALRSLVGERRFAATDVAAAAMVSRMPLGALTSHHLVLAGARGTLAHLDGAMWDQGQLTALAHDLAARGVPVTAFPHPITAAQLRAADPRYLAPWRAHPARSVLLAVAGALLTIAVAVVVVLTML
ncbi:hypothetical protein J1G44_02305 [Cellulomonas sp. zg-ZUI199]|uniref:PH domain-containing protein n=1 Tax=Cellulomonas wangleii TaxID=2816956 RepID=A0ABX8D2H3_9CELL|nr:hypothetical protein [Cellulomonas wangleii]MBO0923314.1 hypothetical protein [Cellulomonas wangleii]QVI61671.1 hypothetical protein KG103_14590 [Cellulomonas wangleii]